MTNATGKMKSIQLVGSRDKSDFVLFLGHVLTNLDKRVLIVDGTQQSLYKHSYTRLIQDQTLFDFQGVDILCGASNWTNIEEHLVKAGETALTYDVILIDMDTKEVIEQDWPEFTERFYIGDFDRAHQLLDVELLNRLFSITGSTELIRITFESNYRIDESYFEALLNQEVKWLSMNYIFEPDEMSESLRLRMQHDQIIPYKNLNKQYKELLNEIVSSLYGIHVKDVADAVKPSLFKNAFKRSNKPILESSNA